MSKNVTRSVNIHETENGWIVIINYIPKTQGESVATSSTFVYPSVDDMLVDLEASLKTEMTAESEAGQVLVPAT